MKSMTGFGRASLESNGKNYIIEIKTVNNKYSDITVKSPKRLSFMEDKIRKQIANRITRGKVEVSVSFFDFSNKSKNVVLNKEIAKEYIKQLREIADENNLSENINVWNNNTIYPQTILIVDLNRLQEINDTKGYEEGDKQIKAAANILIRTQLDNSDIIRTDGNEFVVYLVGYNQKQITNYIHKLNKEFKNLPYDYGAEFGYSMKIDEIKTIEDALNEATKVLKKQKEVNENKD